MVVVVEVTDVMVVMVVVEVVVEVVMEVVAEVAAKAVAMVVTKVAILKHLLSLSFGRFGNSSLHKYKPSSR